MARSQLFILAGLSILTVISVAIFTLLRTESTPTSGTWRSMSGLFSIGEPSTLRAPAEEGYQGQGKETLGLIPLPQQEGGESENSFATDLADLLTKLVQPSQQPGEDIDPAAPGAYSFIPQGLISIETPKSRTPEQEALHEYGNIVGLSLAAFADSHPNMPQTLKDQAEDRADPLKVASLKRLANDFTQLGDELAATEQVPAAAASAHNALVAAYKDVGAKLILIPSANNDDAFLKAVNSYNTSAETLSKRLVALVDLFSTRGVTFSSSDSGSIFTFNAKSSL